MNPRIPCKLLGLFLAALLLQSCGGGTSSGTFLQDFNVTGTWTGTMSNVYGDRFISVSMTLSDAGGTVVGVIAAPDFECSTGGDLKSGTATKAATNSRDDNPLTAGINEGSSKGHLHMQWVPYPDEDTVTRASDIKIVLAGDSSNLRGHYVGNWNLTAGTALNDACGQTDNPTTQAQGVIRITRV